MLKVECESCKAPYQVDERRVPPTGLKMRCPKCGHTFLVTDPSKGGTPAADGIPKPPPPRNQFSFEMDLPAVAPAGGGGGLGADLPVAKNPPGFGGGTDLPSPKG